MVSRIPESEDIRSQIFNSTANSPENPHPWCII